jgi:hypothetical protein
LQARRARIAPFAALSASRLVQFELGRTSIRQPGYLTEHMFPSRLQRIADSLLEVADAMLAPEELPPFDAPEPTPDLPRRRSGLQPAQAASRRAGAPVPPAQHCDVPQPARTPHAAPTRAGAPRADRANRS